MGQYDYLLSDLTEYEKGLLRQKPSSLNSEDRAVRRRLQNKIAAQGSRSRKRRHATELESTTSMLYNRLDESAQTVVHLRQQVNELLQVIRKQYLLSQDKKQEDVEFEGALMNQVNNKKKTISFSNFSFNYELDSELITSSVVPLHDMGLPGEYYDDVEVLAGTDNLPYICPDQLPSWESISNLNAAALNSLAQSNAEFDSSISPQHSSSPSSVSPSNINSFAQISSPIHHNNGSSNTLDSLPKSSSNDSLLSSNNNANNNNNKSQNDLPVRTVRLTRRQLAIQQRQQEEQEQIYERKLAVDYTNTQPPTTTTTAISSDNFASTTSSEDVSFVQNEVSLVENTSNTAVTTATTTTTTTTTTATTTTATFNPFVDNSHNMFITSPVQTAIANDNNQHLLLPTPLLSHSSVEVENTNDSIKIENTFNHHDLAIIPLNIAPLPSTSCNAMNSQDYVSLQTHIDPSYNNYPSHFSSSPSLIGGTPNLNVQVAIAPLSPINEPYGFLNTNISSSPSSSDVAMLSYSSLSLQSLCSSPVSTPTLSPVISESPFLTHIHQNNDVISDGFVLPMAPSYLASML